MTERMTGCTDEWLNNDSIKRRKSHKCNWFYVNVYLLQSLHCLALSSTQQWGQSLRTRGIYYCLPSRLSHQHYHYSQCIRTFVFISFLFSFLSFALAWHFSCPSSVLSLRFAIVNWFVLFFICLLKLSSPFCNYLFEIFIVFLFFYWLFSDPPLIRFVVLFLFSTATYFFDHQINY